MLTSCGAKKRARQLPKNSLATVKNKSPPPHPLYQISPSLQNLSFFKALPICFFKAKGRFVFVKNNGSFHKAPYKKIKC